MNIQQQYKTNITWSCVETIFFQSILLIHQYMLFKVTEPYFYGLMGTLFGCIYFMVKLCDLGLSKILMSFFLDYSQNQQAVYSFLKSQVIPTILLYCMVAVIFLCAHHVFIPKSIVSINNQLIMQLKLEYVLSVLLIILMIFSKN